MIYMDKYNIYSYFFELPLYTKIRVDKAELNELSDLLNFTGRVDAYNPTLKENTTYQVNPQSIRRGFAGFDSYSGYATHYLKCVRTGEVFIVYSHFDNESMILQKIGQFVSIADLHISQIKKYDTVLTKEQLKEFTRAIGLAANGVGIGSFIYLRRIFEGLLTEAYKEAKTDTAWNDEAFKNGRVAEKIELLKKYLPNFLVENKSLYGILSKGVHSLTEEECLQYYETVKIGIELILDEKLEKQQKLKKTEEAKKKISGLNSKLK
jgi:hypothetical protein